jgi:hypothetical protein
MAVTFWVAFCNGKGYFEQFFKKVNAAWNVEFFFSRLFTPPTLTLSCGWTGDVGMVGSSGKLL